MKICDVNLIFCDTDSKSSSKKSWIVEHIAYSLSNPFGMNSFLLFSVVLILIIGPCCLSETTLKDLVTFTENADCPQGWEKYPGSGLAGKVIIGATGLGDQNLIGGQNTVKLEIVNLPSHSHGINNYIAQDPSQSRTEHHVGIGSTDTGANVRVKGPDMPFIGGNQPHNNMQPYKAMTPCYKTSQDAAELSISSQWTNLTARASLLTALAVNRGLIPSSACLFFFWYIWFVGNFEK